MKSTLLALELRKIGCVEYLAFANFLIYLNLAKFSTILSALPPLPLTLPATSSWLTPNAFKANTPDDPVVFNIGVSNAAILLKPYIDHWLDLNNFVKYFAF